MSGGYEDEYAERPAEPADEGQLLPEEPQGATNPLLLPGIFMIITGVVNLLCGFAGIGVGVMFANMPEEQLRQAYNQQDPAKRKQLDEAGIGIDELRKIYVYGGGGGGGFWTACSLLTIIGGICMCARKARGLAIFSALVTVLPCVTSPCCLLGLPVGIWSLIVLFQHPR